MKNKILISLQCLVLMFTIIYNTYASQEIDNHIKNGELKKASMIMQKEIMWQIEYKKLLFERVGYLFMHIRVLREKTQGQENDKR